LSRLPLSHQGLVRRYRRSTRRVVGQPMAGKVEYSDRPTAAGYGHDLPDDEQRCPTGGVRR